MSRIGSAALLLVASAGLSGCAHTTNEFRFRTKVQVVHLAECEKLRGLKRIELELFHNGFMRKVQREEQPVAFELLEDLVSAQPRLVEYVKPDYTRIEGRSSRPYREYLNHYKMAACEEPAGDLFLIVVRHDPDPADLFLGKRMGDAINASGCKATLVASPRDIGFYEDTTEEDILRYIRRGRCRDYALGK